MENDKDHIILDVRSLDEYNGGHIENAICIPKTSKFKQEIPTVINTNVTDTAILFEREWKYFSTKENNNPIINPNDNDKIISINGSKTIERI